MEGGRQLRLLLWRDYLIRKRNIITLAGVLWASGIMFGIYTVRINVDNQDFPTCQFSARALPSAGMVSFLQSFVCNVNNECSPLDQYEEIPAYENSTLTEIQRKLSPVVNETVIELATSMPDAVKLLATIANVADEPAFLQFAKNGMKVNDLFNNPSRVKRYVSSQLELDEDVTQSLMTSDISFQGIVNGDLNICKPDSLSKTFKIENKEHLNIIVKKLCSMTKQELQTMMMDLLYHMDLTKYIKMLGNMYYKMSGDERLTKLGDFVRAVLRMTKLNHFLPPELVGIFQGKSQDFTYIDMNLLQKFVKLFEPTFGDTEQYKSISEFADIVVIGAQYLNKIFGNQSPNDTVEEVTEISAKYIGNKIDLNGFDKINKVLNNAADAANLIGDGESTIDPFDVLTKLTTLIHKFLPNNYKHDFLFYSTILSKLIESAHKVVDINMNLEDIIYNVTLRNPQAVKLLNELPPTIISKGFDALVSPERTQIITSKLNSPGAVFCDVGKMQQFFEISKEDSENVKNKLCMDVWKNYVNDLIQAFGIFDVKNNINEIASLFIQETLGKDTSSQLYTIQHDFEIFKNFTQDLVVMEANHKPGHDWNEVLGIGQDSDFMKVFMEKVHLGKLILISVHGALAKEVINQNTILKYKITPILLDASTMIEALNEQLELTPQNITEDVKNMYGDIVQTVLLTAMDEHKTYKSLSTFSQNVVCKGGENAKQYLEIPNNIDTDKLASALCNAFIAIEEGIKNNSIISKAVSKIQITKHTILQEIKWTKLISSLQKLYLKLDQDYPYIFEYSTYAMDNITQDEVKQLLGKAKEFWFSLKNIQRSLHLSVNLGFRLLDLLDHGLFNMTGPTWLKIKHVTNSAIGPLNVIDDVIKTVAGLLTNTTVPSTLPNKTSEALSRIVPNLPYLIVDSVNILMNDDTDIEPIIYLLNAEPPWPCSSSSISDLLSLSPSSAEAVQGLENLLCLDPEMQEEWISYIDEKKARINRTLTWNNTKFPPHIFLHMSSTFDSLVNDTVLIKNALHYIINDGVNDNHIGLITAWKYAVEALNVSDKNEIIRKFMNKFDTVLNSVKTSTVSSTVSLNGLWEQYIKCFQTSEKANQCRDIGRTTWKYSLRILATIFDNIAEDLTVYFNETNEADSTLLQVLGFTKSTPLYMLYDKLPQFISVLVNSYWDFGFMSQIRRATMTSFWDCDAVVSALSPPPRSPVHKADVARVKPYVCPSFIYWLSMPRGDNVLFNIVAKPQYYIYNNPVENTTSTFENTYIKTVALADLLKDIADKKKTSVTKELERNTLQDKLKRFVDKILNYKIYETDPKYIEFSKIYRDKFMSDVYLTRIVAMTNKISDAFMNLTLTDDANIQNLNAELLSIRNTFRRKAVEIISLHFDAITDVLAKNDEKYTLVDALETLCNNIEKDEKAILSKESRVKLQICSKNYKVLYKEIENSITEDYDEARNSLFNLVSVLRDGEITNETDVFELFNYRSQITESLSHSIKFAYDLGLPYFIKYLQTNIQSYRVLITFLSGGNWWKQLQDIFNGPYANNFFGFVEQSLDITDNVLNNLDGIHLVRLARDLNQSDSDSFCRPNIQLSDYIPDNTGTISGLKEQLCTTNYTDLFGELPPLLFASQGYENSLKLSKDIDYDSLKADLSITESQLSFIKDGPKEPTRPKWVTEQKIDFIRQDMMKLLTKESITKIAFGILSNGVDAGTLFLNSSSCTLCSQLTSWFKQLNLQVIKKPDYDNLLCHLHTMTLQDIYHSLKNDFHWDMFVREIISSRNYTKYELNKSMNEFLDLVKVHLLEDMASPTNKLTECLAKNVSKNEFGNATLFIQVLAHTAKLLQAEVPYLQDIEGIKDQPYLKQLANEIAHNIDVYRPMTDYLRDGVKVGDEMMTGEDGIDVENLEVNLRLALMEDPFLEDLVKPKDSTLINTCKSKCSDTVNNIISKLDLKKIEEDLPKLQMTEYWKFPFITTILQHVESILSHTARLTGVASSLDVKLAMEGKFDAVLDVLIVILIDDNVDAIGYSLEGLIKGLHPLLKNTPLEDDMDALGAGLKIINQFKTYLVEEVDLKLPVSEYFNSEGVEIGLMALGINNTNFWSLAAPRIGAGYLNLKPVISPKTTPYHISAFVCNMETMSSAIIPSNLDVVTLDDVLAATVDQFCGIDQEKVMDVVGVLFRNVKITAVIDKLKEVLLSKLYTASNLTPSQGSNVLNRFPRMAELLPTLQDKLGEIMDLVVDEPLFKTLKDFSSVGNLLGSSGFMADAGRMMCGKPFKADMSRIIQNIIKSKDQIQQVDQRQLDSLPTDFCRSMYQEIISIEGGKIVWSFIKPLVMGRILYTPDTPQVRNIMGKVNETFANMIRLTNLVHSFADAFPSLDSISSHRDGLVSLQQLMNRPGMEAVKQNILGDVQLNVDINGMFQKLGDFKDISGLISKASSMLHCIRLDRISAVDNETVMMHKAAQLTMTYEFSAGIVFLNPEKLTDSLNNVEYKIRMDIENAPTTHRMKNFMWVPGPEASFIENMRYFRGFIQLQDLIDKAIIKLSMEHSKQTSLAQVVRRAKRDEQTQSANTELALRNSVNPDIDWAVYTQQIPYPCYKKDYFQTSLYESQALIVGFFFSMLFTVVSVVRFTVADKESGNTMLMSVMGVNLSYHTLSWFIASFIEVTVTVLCVATILKWGQVLPNTSFSIIFTLIFIFGIAMLSFCYMLSKMFSSASFAAVSAGIILLITFMPFVVILSLETTLAGIYRFLVCLLMSSSLCYSFLHVTRFETMGVGMSWSTLLDSPSGDATNVLFAAGMMLLDAALYFAIGWCLDRYFGIKSLSNSISKCSSTSEKAGVSIVNVTKVYGEGSRRSKVALDNVSMELQRGHITTLLGHNGAGKTTLIKILTGMLKPTKGHIIIREEGRSSRSSAGAGVGVCPQHDVLVDCLTTREHVTLYAHLDADAHENVDQLVDKMLDQMSLSRYAEVVVSALSGGTRRRLCVALAFVARAHLTVLDEPTAGVDPANRRDIWSMIMKLREGRTILLTTHHLDEAEILSDQIVIMHKGQIHTTGSPVEIKRSLGSGYKLTVMLSDRQTDDRTDEQAKLVLSTVRQVVKNATVSDVTDTQVDIMMPFYDADGASNNFLHLCTILEESQPRLGFTNFTLDCSSLEQVFFDICTKADTQNTVEYATEGGSGSAGSTTSCSLRSSQRALVAAGGARRGGRGRQLAALLTARALHLSRNRPLFFMLLIMPIVFVTLAMAFSTLRPPADNEFALPLTEALYNGSTQFLVPHTSMSMKSDTIDSRFAEQVLQELQMNKDYRDWTEKDSPICKCESAIQHCEFENVTQPEMMILPDVDTLNNWLVDSQQAYIEKRYGGFTSSIKNNLTTYIAWYNNKGHHSMPVFVNTLNNAILRTIAGSKYNITTYSHPMKISKEQISKDTVYQHIADAGVSALVLVALALCGAGGAAPLVAARARRDERLQRLAAVAPAVYWTAALLSDLAVIFINMVLTAIVMYAFGFPVFVARNNLPAICVLIMLYGFACCSLVHVFQKLFTDASLANMMLFCGNAFCGLIGIAVLLILDVISESDATDNARWVLHKVFLLAPQFALGDGLLEIAKNTVQALVLERFGMDTYRDPFTSDLLALHYLYLVCVGVFFFLLNLAIEGGHLYWIVDWFNPKVELDQSDMLEPEEITMERKRVAAARNIPYDTVALPTLGNINKGFVHTEGKKNSLQRTLASSRDVLSCEHLTKVYGGSCAGARGAALADLTLGVQPGQCLALLGENGAGKSTTFSLWTGELRPTSGDIYLHGIKRNQRGLERGLISYCPQSDAVDPLLTVRETLQLYCRLRGIDEEDEVISRTLEMFDLVKYSEVRSGDLSGGNRRKLCTAIAVAGRAPLLLLDEPTSGMDPVSRRCVWRGVAAARGAGRGVLLSTHALDDARRAATAVALLRAGRLAALAPLQDCLDRFGGGYVVSCRSGAARAAWRRVRAAAPHARLRVVHYNTLHFLIPNRITVDKKETTTRLSDIFRLMAELQATTDIEDFTVNQSSLEQMFLSFSDKSELELEEDLEPSRRNSEQMDSITSL